MASIGVMHMIDTLSAGGAERVAVNIANLLPQERYTVHLCTTRRDGPLAMMVASHVNRLSLMRRSRFDLAAVRRLTAYIRDCNIKIIHAHTTSVFLASVAALPFPHPVVVWHDHLGLPELRRRPVWRYRILARFVRGVVAVTRPSATWGHQVLRVRPDRIWYIPNFVCEPPPSADLPELPGESGMRMVCVANLRPQKDHLTLIRAMGHVLEREPRAHLLLVGDENDATYRDAVREEITTHNLQRKVSLLGRRVDVSALLAACDIGVLSSASEGFPLALIEYGAAGLPAVATHVGECAEILDNGRAGILVPPSAPGELADALLALLHSPADRARLGRRFQLRVREQYSPAAIVTRICNVYDTLLETDRVTASAANRVSDVLD